MRAKPPKPAECSDTETDSAVAYTDVDVNLAILCLNFVVWDALGYRWGSEHTELSGCCHILTGSMLHNMRIAPAIPIR